MKVASFLSNLISDTYSVRLDMTCFEVYSTLSILPVFVIQISHQGGLGDFIANTGQSLPMLTGNVVALVAGGVICLIVSYVTSDQAL